MKIKLLFLAFLSALSLIPLPTHCNELGRMWMKENFMFGSAYISTGRSYTAIVGFNHEVNIYENAAHTVVAHFDNTFQILDFINDSEILFLNDTSLVKYDLATASAERCPMLNPISSVVSGRPSSRNCMFSHDKTLYYILSDSCVDVYDLQIMEHDRMIVLPSSLREVYQLVVSNDNRLFAYVYSEYIHIWDMQSGTRLDSIPSILSNVDILTFTPDGRRLIEIDPIYDKKILIHDVQTGLVVDSIQNTSYINSIEFYPDGNRMLANGTTIIDLGARTITSFSSASKKINMVGGVVHYFGYDGRSAWLEDTNAIVNPVYYNTIKFLDYSKDERNLIFKSMSSALNDFYVVDATSGMTTLTKTCDTSARVLGYIKEQDQYYLARQVGSDVVIDVRDFATDALVDTYTYPATNLTNFEFIFGNKYAVIDNFIYVDWATKTVVSKSSIPEFSKINLVPFTQTDTATGIPGNFIMAVNSITQDTSVILNNYTSYGMLPGDRLFWGVVVTYYDKMPYYKMVVLDVATLDTVRIFDTDDTLGFVNYEPNVHIYKERFMLISYTNYYWLLWDMIKNRITARFYYGDYTIEPYFRNFSDDLTLVTASCRIDGDSSAYYTQFRTYIDPSGIAVLQPVAAGSTIRSYPNPASAAATLEFNLDRPGYATITITDLRGNESPLAVDQFYEQGPHSLAWDASALAPGVYYCRLALGTSQTTCPLVVVR